MAVESKPLFHPEVIRQQVRSFSLPESVENWQPKLQHWASLIASGRADDFKETALLPDFLTDIFCGLLGYTGPAGSADTFTFSRDIARPVSRRSRRPIQLWIWALNQIRQREPALGLGVGSLRPEPGAGKSKSSPWGVPGEPQRPPEVGQQ